MTKTLTPAWSPTKEYIAKTNLAKTMIELNTPDYKALHRFSVEHFEKFWDYTIKKLGVQFDSPYQKICDLTAGVTAPVWLPQAKLNIVNSCFNAGENVPAIIYQSESSGIQTTTYKQLNKLSNRIAKSLQINNFTKGDCIAIAMPMHVEAVAIYLGIIKAGCVVVSIADSFSADEIATRLEMTHTKAIFTQDFILRDKKRLPLYEKVIAANAPVAIVLSCEDKLTIPLHKGDLAWSNFLSNEELTDAVICAPEDPINILFSSGTTGTPKAIVWDHSTAIKCASDGYYHHDIKNTDIFAWPTNLGWMMGPWLIFASLINCATMGLFDGTPTSRQFGEFVQNANVSLLGVVPSLVATWRASKCMEGLNWQAIKLFSSSGECSNSDDMLYLMSLAGGRPIIEYCGGTEIGGAYITSTVIEPNIPATFTTAALGLDFLILDEHGNLSDDGEVVIIPPSIGLSNKLVNGDNYQVYYADMPHPNGRILRRHGDHIEKLNENYYRALGRVDDTMNLGGIKTSSVEIERTLAKIDSIKETAAVAITPEAGGPSQLVIFTILKNPNDYKKTELLVTMQNTIKKSLNPLFKIHDIVIVDSLPRTASNKIMRRVLRKQYTDNV